VRGSLRRAWSAALVAVACGAATSAHAQAEAEIWSFSVATRLSHSTNVIFVPSGSSDTIGILIARLGYGRVRRNYSFSAGAWVIGNKFRTFDAFDGVRGGVDASGTFALSPVTKLSLSEAFGSGFNPERLYGTGELLPQVDVLSNVASVGLSHAFTRSTTGDVSFDTTWFRYSSDLPVTSPQFAADTFPEQVAGPDLGVGRPPPFGLQPNPLLYSLNLAALEGFLASRYEFLSYRVGGGLSHEFGKRTQGRVHIAYRDTRYSDRPDQPWVAAGVFEAGGSVRRALDSTAGLSLSYLYQRSTDDLHIDTHTVTGQFDKEITGKWSLNASLGASFYEQGQGQDSGWSMVGGIGASKRWKRGGAAARYERTVYQALGFGRVLTTQLVYVAGSYVPWERVIVGAYVGLSDNGDQFEDLYTFGEVFVGAYATVRVKKRTAIGLDYAYRRYSFGSLRPAGANIFGVSVTYGRLWK
jgi:hypothetical protein